MASFSLKRNVPASSGKTVSGPSPQTVGFGVPPTGVPLLSSTGTFW